ncbi:tail fiber assembly protein, partial [Xenorhabdus bovienii]|uniref:tail fiber assembly protein n=1 Tax=Xenorhabdus bovienii TaxID=40576 RepID=UPI000571844B
MYFYSAKTNAFYAGALKQDYINAGTWPDDGIEISHDDYTKFLKPPAGKIRIADPDGFPEWADIPPPTPEELQRRAESQKQNLMSTAREKIAICQDAVDLGIA